MAFQVYAESISLVDDLKVNKSKIVTIKGRLQDISNDTFPEDTVLMGALRAQELNAQENLIQVVWTEIRNKKNKKVRVVLDRPMTTSFKTKERKLQRSSKMPIVVDEELLHGAIVKLNSLNFDEGEIVAKGIAKNADSKGREINVIETDDMNNNVEDDFESDEKQAIAKTIIDEEAIKPLPSLKGKSNRSNLSGYNLEGHSFSQKLPFNSSEGNELVQFSKPKEEAKEGSPPKVRSEETTDGCHGEIVFDLNNAKAIVKKRTRMFENDVEVFPKPDDDWGSCELSDEFYFIKKDYSITGVAGYDLNCIVPGSDGNLQYVCAKYQNFYVTPDGARHYFEDEVKIDYENAYPIAEESTNCGFHIDLEKNKAYQMIEEVFYGLNGVRVALGACKVGETSESFELEETTDGCPLLHDLNGNTSKVSKRIIFNVAGQVEEALSCYETEESLPHEFSISGCRPLINPVLADYALMAKRLVTLPNGEVEAVSGECEVISSEIPLNSTREGCEHQFVHDFPAGKSYMKKLFFYEENGRRHYLSDCLRTNDEFPHYVEKYEYDHDDVKKRSNVRFSIHIEGPEGREILKKCQGGSEESIPYEKIGEVDRQTSKTIFEGCYKAYLTDRIADYRRADGSSYEEKIGPGVNVVDGVNLCETKTERKLLVSHTILTRRGKDSRDILAPFERTVITYPDGHIEESEWVKVE